jgi:hypothetical protein
LFNWNGQSQYCILRSDLPNSVSSFVDVPAALVGAKDCGKIEIIWPEIFPVSDSTQGLPTEPSATSTTMTRTTTLMTTTATTTTTNSRPTRKSSTTTQPKTTTATTITESSTITTIAEGVDLADSEPKRDRSVFSRILHSKLFKIVVNSKVH